MDSRSKIGRTRLKGNTLTTLALFGIQSGKKMLPHTESVSVIIMIIECKNSILARYPTFIVASLSRNMVNISLLGFETRPGLAKIISWRAKNFKPDDPRTPIR